MRLTWTLLGGIGLGAGLMYFLDPQRGVRRRVVVRHTPRVMNVIPVGLNSTALDRGAHAGSLAAHTGTGLRPLAKSAPKTNTDGAIRQCHLTPRGPSLASLWQELRARLSRVYGVPADEQPPRQVSLGMKISYSLFLCVLVPVYIVKYGPSNFLWFSDIALIVTLVALWWESRLLASTQVISVVLLESLWILDFLLGLVSGESPLGLAAYMFDRRLSLFLRTLSLFHLVLPPLLLWLVFRLGYDRRALCVQTLMAWVVLPLCYLLTAPSDNINWVFGPGDKPQTWMPSFLYFLLVMAFFPLGIYLPTHLLFLWWCDQAEACGPRHRASLALV